MSNCADLFRATPQQDPAAVQLVSKANPNRVAGTNRATTTEPHRRYEQLRNATPTQSGTSVCPRVRRGGATWSPGRAEVIRSGGGPATKPATSLEQDEQ